MCKNSKIRRPFNEDAVPQAILRSRVKTGATTAPGMYGVYSISNVCSAKAFYPSDVRRDKSSSSPMGPDVLSNALSTRACPRGQLDQFLGCMSYMSGGVCGALQIFRRATQQVGASLPLACV